MENTFDKTAVESIELLESRLRRIEFAVGTASTPITADKPTGETAVQRLANLEYSLHQLASKSNVIQGLLRLRKSSSICTTYPLTPPLDAKYPDLFQALDTNDLPTTLDTASLLSIVLASASAFPSTASRLTSIMDVPIPQAELSTQLINLVPRIAKLEVVQASQNAEISQLRERSAVLVQKWYSSDILRAGGSWADMESRVGQVEQQVRRAALARRLENDTI